MTRLFQAFYKLLCVADLLLCLNGCADTLKSNLNGPNSESIFEKKSVMSGEGRASAVAFAIEGKGYIALGRNSAGSLKDCWQYDPENDKWQQMSDFPGMARVKAIAAVVGTSAYVGLGYSPETGEASNSAAFLKDFWMYNSATDTWTEKAQFPSNYSDACVCFVVNNEIYVGSGFSGSGSSNEFWKYNTTTDTWTRLNTFSGDNREVATACAGISHCYFGTGFQCKSYNDWWEYLPATDSWIKRKEIPDHGRQNAVSIAVGDRYFIATGRYWKGSVIANEYLRADITEYDPAHNNWISRGCIPDGKRENAIAFTINEKIYIGFGEDDMHLKNDFWCFQP